MASVDVDGACGRYVPLSLINQILHVVRELGSNVSEACEAPVADRVLGGR